MQLAATVRRSQTRLDTRLIIECWDVDDFARHRHYCHSVRPRLTTSVVVYSLRCDVVCFRVVWSSDSFGQWWLSDCYHGDGVCTLSWSGCRTWCPASAMTRQTGRQAGDLIMIDVLCLSCNYFADRPAVSTLARVMQTLGTSDKWPW